LRPSSNSCAISSPYASQRLAGPHPGFLADGSLVTSLAGFASESVIRLMAGFESSLPESVIGVDGRFCRNMASPPARTPKRNPGHTQILAGRLSTHSGRLLDAPQRPSKPAQCNDLFSFFSAQDVAHDHRG